jgi:hypothetical protein
MLFNVLICAEINFAVCICNTRVELAVSHRVPPQVADRGMLITYIGAAVMRTAGAKGMGPRQKAHRSS